MFTNKHRYASVSHYASVEMFDSLNSAGLVISNIDIDIIHDTFDVSISMILSYKSIDRGIDDTLLAFFFDITSILLN